MANGFKENFASMRKEKRLTQAEVAEKLHVSPQAVSKWENGESMPDISLLPDIAKLFGTTIDALLGLGTEPAVEVVEPPKKGDYSDYVFRVVMDDDGDKVRINLPLSIVAAMMKKTGELNFGRISISSSDIENVLSMVDQGIVGDLVSIEGKDGETVKIFVEKRK